MQNRNLPYGTDGVNHKRNSGRRITVTGEGKISIVPDEAILQLGVNTEHTELLAAQSENAKITANIQQQLLTLGIDQRDIQTAGYQVHPVYDYQDGKQIFRGYQVEHMLKITVRDISQTGIAVDTAVKNGANRVSSITFSTSDTGEYYRRALSLAVQDSIKKAQVIAAGMHVTLNTTPVTVTENVLQGDIIPFQTAVFSKSNAETSVEPGQLLITSSVTTEFKFE